jgi:Rieske Fe-S protein
MKHEISRRGFLGVLFGLFSALGLSSARIGMAAGSGEKWVEVGKRDDFVAGTPKLIKDKKLYVLRDDSGFSALSAKCTHFGCVVDREADGTFLCPCHGSAYDAKGLVTKGPARKPLVWYQTKEEGDTVFVNLKGIVEPK